MYGKSVTEIILWGLFYSCLTVVVILLLLCVWGMFSRDFIRFATHAIFVSCFGVLLLCLCVGALGDAETARKQAQDKRDMEHMMHFESKTIITQDGEIIIETFPEQDIFALRKENADLKMAIKDLGFRMCDTEKERAAEREGYRNQYNALVRKYEDRVDEIGHFQRLLASLREKLRIDAQTWRERIEVSHLERMELLAWRKTEKVRKQRDDKLRSRVQKVRKRKKIAALISAMNDFGAASKAERDYNIPDDRLEISNAIIALVEYLQPHNPSEELQTYLWDCRTAEVLIADIRSSVVKTAFGSKWEERLLSGLIGLNIIPPVVPAPIIVPTITVPKTASKPKGKKRKIKKRPAK